MVFRQHDESIYHGSPVRLFCSRMTGWGSAFIIPRFHNLFIKLTCISSFMQLTAKRSTKKDYPTTPQGECL